MKTSIMGIYKITNKVNGKFYIGSSKNIMNRWETHIEDLIDGKHHSYKFQKEYNEYGITNFNFEVLQIIQNKQDLKIIEQKWINDTQCFKNDIGYNISISAFEKKTELDKKIQEDKIKRTRNQSKKEENIENEYCNSSNKLVQAIANHDIEYLRNIINCEAKYFDSKVQCFKEIYQFDFSYLFNDSKCILCNKDNIKIGYNKKHKTYLYVCEECLEKYKPIYKGYNIKMLFCKIAQFKTFKQEDDFMLKIFNYTYDEIKEKEFLDKNISIIKAKR